MKNQGIVGYLCNLNDLTSFFTRREEAPSVVYLSLNVIWIFFLYNIYIYKCILYIADNLLTSDLTTSCTNVYQVISKV
jgi:hypothetical protein